VLCSNCILERYIVLCSIRGNRSYITIKMSIYNGDVKIASFVIESGQRNVTLEYTVTTQHNVTLEYTVTKQHNVTLDYTVCIHTFYNITVF
jgi:hypothetical protein